MQKYNISFKGQKIFIGIDVHKKNWDVAIAPEVGIVKRQDTYEFVYLLSHASYICMDSFHATIFALKFKKEFVHMLKNRDDQEAGSPNTRMYDLFERYGLLYKIYDNHPNEWMKCIDYQRVSNIMDKEARESFEFLKYEIAN